MAEGRFGGTQARMAIGLLMIALVLLNGELAQSTVYTVGDDKGGWTSDVKDWPNGKTFYAGDELLFNYTKGSHNVLRVEEADYRQCILGTPLSTYSTGEDYITLERGTQYFICGIHFHCAYGNMKIQVTAL